MILISELLHYGRSSFVSQRLHYSNLPSEFLKNAVLVNGDHLTYRGLGFDVDPCGFTRGLVISIPDFGRSEPDLIWEFPSSEQSIFLSVLPIEELEILLSQNSIKFQSFPEHRQIAFTNGFIHFIAESDKLQSNTLFVYLR